jgi:hypothetical protein
MPMGREGEHEELWHPCELWCRPRPVVPDQADGGGLNQIGASLPDDFQGSS